MEMNVANANTLPLGVTAKATPNTTKTEGKADATSNPFGHLLQSIADLNSSTTGDEKKSTDPLLTLMMALQGGLTPAMLAQLTTTVTTTGEEAKGPVLQLKLGGQNLTLSLQSLPLNNSQLAALLQKFGAGQALTSQLLADPQGQPAQLLAAHPDLMPDLNQTLNQAVQLAVTNPVVALQDPQVAELMKSVLAQLAVKDTTQGKSQANGASSKQPAALGKLQATFSAHAVQVTGNTEQESGDVKTANPVNQPVAPVQQTSNAPITLAAAGASTQTRADKPQEQQMPTSQQAPATPVTALPIANPLQMQTIQAPLQAPDSVVLMNANQFQTEFQELMVKRAALIESPGRQEFRIVLQPQGMGEIEVRVQAVNNQISLHFSADSAQAKGLLDSGLSGLRSQLQEQGIRFDRIEVTQNYSNGEFGSGLPQERGGSSQNFQGQSGSRSQKRAVRDPFTIGSVQETSDITEATTVPQNLDGIDVTA